MDYKKRPYKRNDRLSKEIKIILSDFILKDFNLKVLELLPYLKLDVSSDLRNAKVYFSVIDNSISNENLTEELNKKSKFIKGIIGKIITSKNIPEIKFYFDDSIEFYDKIDRIFSWSR